MAINPLLRANFALCICCYLYTIELFKDPPERHYIRPKIAQLLSVRARMQWAKFGTGCSPLRRGNEKAPPRLPEFSEWDGMEPQPYESHRRR